MNIVLIGFASSGKSTTAKAICERTGARHVDLDRAVEERYGRERGRRLSCREIFADLGAGGFETFENGTLRELLDMADTVLSTGGRAPMNEDNRPLLKAFGKIVYLKCGIDAVLRRMKKKGYPLSMGGSAEGVAAEWGRREPVYAGLADITIENDKISPDETARTILEILSADKPPAESSEKSSKKT